jgi:hypothetical protein
VSTTPNSKPYSYNTLWLWKVERLKQTITSCQTTRDQIPNLLLQLLYMLLILSVYPDTVRIRSDFVCEVERKSFLLLDFCRVDTEPPTLPVAIENREHRCSNIQDPASQRRRQRSKQPGHDSTAFTDSKFGAVAGSKQTLRLCTAFQLTILFASDSSSERQICR